MADVTVRLDGDQALVLFEMLARRSETGGRITADHDGERAVLDLIEATLESQLPELLAPDYRELVAQARERVAA